MVVIEERPFLSGVIEGFYGRPWTCKQRNELFTRIRKYGMNTYIYAPKDDMKHRALWRQLYTAEEEGKLATLITAAESAGVTFVYAISPGLDIVFSCAADVAALKRKMKQVSKLGCKSFAILFDDIDPRLKVSDCNLYKSSAEAQSILTNELFQYLKKPRFLFCPTEYCKTRAFPSVGKSEYLNTIGTKLSPEIDILWTGDKVISQVITPESLLELSKVLRRKPVIWDNIHANDYDHRRVFLGPYSGRPVELYKYLNGVLTNPNCEFEANFVGIHTFATWCRVASNAYKETADCTQEQDSCDLGYDPMEVQIDENVDVPDTEGTMHIDLYPLTPADVTSVVTSYDPKIALKLAIDDWLVEFDKPKAVEVKSYAKRHTMASIVNGQMVHTGQYGLDITSGEESSSVDIKGDAKTSGVTVADLSLLVDLFYLPYEHGISGKALLDCFRWLRDNAGQVNKNCQLFGEKDTSWRERAANFHSLCQMVLDLFTRLSNIPNESILFDLYPYIWDVKEVVLALHAYVIWLATSNFNETSTNDIADVQVFPGEDLPLADFIAEEYVEAWHARYIGGVTLALQKLMPFNGGFGFLDTAPDLPSSDIFYMRPFLDHDKDTLLGLCTTFQCPDKVLNIENSETICNVVIEPYLNKCSNTLFILEHNHQICGYVAAVPNNKTFMESMNCTSDSDLDSSERKKYDCPLSRLTDWHLDNKAHLIIHVDQKTKNARVLKRVLSMVLSVLKSLGSNAVILEVNGEEEHDMYSKLGFQPVDTDISGKVVIRAL
ncbi:protein O-GlcNAcase-like [Rhopilema esculentum]|uniref:protein O-GlcNAcase-like n=1 Tax=Rhopilema esculentum TaxID=499914 RepID=UPI0031D12165|eukprot:gene17667-9319_t